MKIYFAGPDVFRQDAQAWAAEVRTRCRAQGFTPLIPLDKPAQTAADIYAQNIAMICEADAVVANLDPFRGAEPDSGTVFEVGYAVALGKKVVGYLSCHEPLTARIARWQGGALQATERGWQDQAGCCVEDFGLPVNLMLGVPVCITAGGIEAALSQLAP